MDLGFLTRAEALRYLRDRGPEIGACVLQTHERDGIEVANDAVQNFCWHCRNLALLASGRGTSESCAVTNSCVRFSREVAFGSSRSLRDEPRSDLWGSVDDMANLAMLAVCLLCPQLRWSMLENRCG